MIEIGGPTPVAQYDRVSVGMTVAIDATVRVKLIDLNDPQNNTNPFSPEFGQWFDVLIADGIDLTGATIALPALGGTRYLDFGVVDAGEGLEALRLQVVPEPTTLTLLSVGLIVIVFLHGVAQSRRPRHSA